MIVRILRRLRDGAPPPADTDEAADRRDDRRVRLARAAGRVHGIETLVVGWQGPGRGGGSADSPNVVMIAWRDVESMLGASSRDELGFVRERLGLNLETCHAETYEVMSRTFASLPTPSSVLRILTLAVRPNVEGALFELVRELQARLSDRGLIASHVARRATLDRTEALIVGVWRDHAAIDAATGGDPSKTAFAEIIDPLVDSITIETYEALEIAPRLPLAAGPPILVLDDQRRIVDLTPSAAATLGRTQDEAVGMTLDELTVPESQETPLDWGSVLGESGEGRMEAGESAWTVPSGGDVLVRWRLRRHTPVAGRHTILVRRRQDPEPAHDDLDAALAEAFPRDPTLINT